MFAGNSPYGTGTPSSASSFPALGASNSHHHMNIAPGNNTQPATLDGDSHSLSRAPGTAFSAPPPPNSYMQVAPTMQYQSHYAPPPPMYSQYAPPPQSINANPSSMMSPYASMNHSGFPSPYASMGGPPMNQRAMAMGMQASMTGAPPNMYIKDEAADAAMIAAMSAPTGSNAAGRKRKKPTAVAVAAGVGAGAILNSNGMYVPLRSQLDAEARATRIRKHNEAEVRRRQRLKNLLTELGQAIECKKEHKSAILRAAIERVKILSDKLNACGVNVKELLLTAEKAQQLAGDGDDDDDDDPEEKEQTPAAKAPAVSVTQSAPAVVTPAETNESKRAKTDSSIATTSSSAAVKVEPEVVPAASVSLSVPSSPQLKKATAPALLTVEKEPKTQASTPTSSPIFAPALDTTAPPILGVDHHSIFHSSSVAMDIVDPQGNILDCNQAFANFCGYPREVLIQSGTTFLGLTHPDSLQESFKIMSALISGQKRVIRGNKKYVNSKGVVKNTIITCWLIPRDLHKRRDLSSQGMSSSSSESNGSHASNTSNPTGGSVSVTGSTLIQAMIEEIPIEWTWQDYVNSLAQALQPIRTMGAMGPPSASPIESKSAPPASNAAASSSASTAVACADPVAVTPTVAVAENSS